MNMRGYFFAHMFVLKQHRMELLRPTPSGRKVGKWRERKKIKMPCSHYILPTLPKGNAHNSLRQKNINNLYPLKQNNISFWIPSILQQANSYICQVVIIYILPIQTKALFSQVQIFFFGS
jgi:hypothetical protein